MSMSCMKKDSRAFFLTDGDEARKHVGKCLKRLPPQKQGEAPQLAAKRTRRYRAWELGERLPSAGTHPRRAAPAPQTPGGRGGAEEAKGKPWGGWRLGPGLGHGAAGALAALLVRVLVPRQRPRSRSRCHLLPDGTSEQRATGSRLPGTERAPLFVSFPSFPVLSLGWGRGASEPGGSWGSPGLPFWDLLEFLSWGYTPPTSPCVPRVPGSRPLPCLC